MNSTKLEAIKRKYTKLLKAPRKKLGPIWSKNVLLVCSGILIGVVGVAILNPGHIVQRSLNLIGIETDLEKTAQSENTSQTEQDTINKSGNSTSSGVDGSDKKDSTDKKDGTTAKNQSDKTSPEPTGSHTVITPEDIQAQKDSGKPLLIARTDWNVKVNSRSPTSCGTSSNPCSIGQQAKVDVSAYNTHTNELLPITECNGVVSKLSVSSDPAPTSLPNAYHCELTYTPTSNGTYWFQIELYLSKTVYTDTIYWGGWVWGSGSPGYVVN